MELHVPGVDHPTGRRVRVVSRADRLASGGSGLLIAALESKWYAAGDVQLHVRESSRPGPEDRPAVVLVHGPAGSSRALVPLAEGLSAGFRVLAPDLPGHGLSPRDGPRPSI